MISNACACALPARGSCLPVVAGLSFFPLSSGSEEERQLHGLTHKANITSSVTGLVRSHAYDPNSKWIAEGAQNTTKRTQLCSQKAENSLPH
jgi:hypothetical protein